MSQKHQPNQTRTGRTQIAKAIKSIFSIGISAILIVMIIHFVAYASFVYAEILSKKYPNNSGKIEVMNYLFLIFISIFVYKSFEKRLKKWK